MEENSIKWIKPAHAAQLIEDGAHIIDIGGESTRPGAALVSEQEELSRVIPVIEKITKELDIPISIDTYKAPVADEAVKAGASIINDVWGRKLILKWRMWQRSTTCQSS